MKIAKSILLLLKEKKERLSGIHIRMPCGRKRNCQSIVEERISTFSVHEKENDCIRIPHEYDHVTIESGTNYISGFFPIKKKECDKDE